MLLQINHIHRRDQRTGEPLLTDISLTIQGGERIALSGKSGSGKSLLMRSIALLDPLDEGNLTWNEQSVCGNAVPAYRSQVVYLSQQAVVTEDTVNEALRRPFLYRNCNTKTLNETRTVDQLRTLGRTKTFIEKRASDLSGGEKQITALLRALAVEPSVLLLDEATSALDAETTLAAEQLVHAWQSEKPAARSAIWVSHDAAQSKRIADRIIEIEAGRLKEDT